MKKFFLCLLIFTLHAYAADDLAKVEDITNQSIEKFNNQEYADSLVLLDSIKNSRHQYVNWYYYYALNQTYLNKYDEAIRGFNTYINKSNINNSAKAYYYIGLIQFRRGEYDKALNSLELSLDVSGDPELDKMTEKLIDKVIRYQNHFENSKKNNVTFLAGYNYDTDVLNLSPDSFADGLSGHVFSYGVSISRKVVDRYNFIFEPTLAILDNYTMDKSFKSDSNLQSSDALQFLLSVPIRFFFEDEEYPNQFDFSLNGYAVYIPINTSTRELSLSSFFVKANVLTPYSPKWAIKYNTLLAVDKSYGFNSDDDDASGLRFEFLTTFVNNLPESKNLFYDIGVNYNSAKGANSRYGKYIAGVGYGFPSFKETYSSVRLGYFYLNYPDKSSARIDSNASLSYNVSKEIDSKSSLSFSAAAAYNNSNSELNKYTDINLGIQYSYNFGF